VVVTLFPFIVPPYYTRGGLDRSLDRSPTQSCSTMAPMLLWFGRWSFVVRLAAKDGVRRMAPTALAFFFFLTFLTGGPVPADLSANWPPNGCCVPAACGTFPSRACSIA
jgi:hypothetical protein